MGKCRSKEVAEEYRAGVSFWGMICLSVEKIQEIEVMSLVF